MIKKQDKFTVITTFSSDDNLDYTKLNNELIFAIKIKNNKKKEKIFVKGTTKLLVTIYSQ